MIIDTLAESSFSKELKPTELVKIRRVSFAFLFRVITNKQFIDKLEVLVDSRSEARDFKKKLMWKGDIALKLKLFLYNAKVNKLSSRRAVAGRRHYQVGVLDAQEAYKELKWLSPKLKMKYKENNKESVEEWNTWLEAILEEVRLFTRKFVYRKLRFVVEANGLEFEDIIMELYGKAINTLYFYYPNIDSQLHAVNIAKRVIHNHGINVIMKYNSAKLGRIQKDVKGFINNTINIDSAIRSTALKDELNIDVMKSLSTSITGGSTSEENFILALDVKKILSTASKKRSDFIRLLMGEFNHDYTLWLREQKVILEEETNMEYYDRVQCKKQGRDKFISRVCEFLHISNSKFKKFISRTTRELKEYNEK